MVQNERNPIHHSTDFSLTVHITHNFGLQPTGPLFLTVCSVRLWSWQNEQHTKTPLFLMPVHSCMHLSLSLTHITVSLCVAYLSTTPLNFMTPIQNRYLYLYRCLICYFRSCCTQSNAKLNMDPIRLHQIWGVFV